MIRRWTSLKTLCFWIIAMFPLVVLPELLSYFALENNVPSRIRGRVGRGDVQYQLAMRRNGGFERPVVVQAAARDGASDGLKESGLMMFHPVLGWDYRPDLVYKDLDGIEYRHDDDGARHTCTSFSTTSVAAYGDSFTYCSNVPDEKTWQSVLAGMLGTNVLNFGVGGYGTDQAALKYRLYGKLHAKVVMLCILPENINRVVNIYRPFYTYNDPLALTKPRFVLGSDGPHLIPNPIGSPVEVARLDDAKFLDKLGRMDYWYQFDRRLPSISFPYIYSLFQWRGPVLANLGLTLSRVLPGSHAQGFPGNLFDEAEPLALMCHIVDLFVETARERGSQPIIVIMPHKDYVEEQQQFGISRVKKLLSHLQAKNYQYVDLVGEMAAMNPSRSQLDRWYRSHATAEGNEMVANLLARYFHRIKAL